MKCRQSLYSGETFMMNRIRDTMYVQYLIQILKSSLARRNERSVFMHCLDGRKDTGEKKK